MPNLPADPPANGWRERLQVAFPGIGAAFLHGSGLAIRLGFVFALLALSGAELLGRYGLLASIEVVAIYLAGFELHAFTTRRYARRPQLAQVRICLAAHRRLFLISVPLAMAGAYLATLLLDLNLDALELGAFLLVIATGVIAQDLLRYITILKGTMRSATIGFIRTAAWQPIALALASTVAPLRSIVIMWAIAGLLSVLWGMWMLGPPVFARIRIRRLYLLSGLWTARRFYLMACASVLQGNMERFVLQASLGAEAVGLFVFFQNMANALPTLIQVSVHNAALPAMLTQFGQRLPDRFDLLRRLFRQTLLASAAIATLTTVCVLILLLLAPMQPIQYFWILPALLLAQTLQTCSQPFYLALFAAHQDRPIMWLSLALLLVSLTLCIVLVEALALIGAITSQIGAGLAILTARMFMMRAYARRGQL